jgi:hypothetical protein
MCKFPIYTITISDVFVFDMDAYVVRLLENSLRKSSTLALLSRLLPRWDLATYCADFISSIICRRYVWQISSGWQIKPPYQIISTSYAWMQLVNAREHEQHIDNFLVLQRIARSTAAIDRQEILLSRPSIQRTVFTGEHKDILFVRAI